MADDSPVLWSFRFQSTSGQGTQTGQHYIILSQSGKCCNNKAKSLISLFELILCFRVIETETSRFSNNPRFFVLVSEKLEDLNCKVNQF